MPHPTALPLGLIASSDYGLPLLSQPSGMTLASKSLHYV
jgi:hypothetical protein